MSAHRPNPASLLGFSGRTGCPGPGRGVNAGGRMERGTLYSVYSIKDQLGVAWGWWGRTEFSLSCGHLCGTSPLRPNRPQTPRLPPNTSPFSASPGHSITKVNKCNVFLLLQMTGFHPLPAGVGGGVVEVTVLYKSNNFYKTKTKESAQGWEAEMSSGVQHKL